jgi:hypothetical protein
MSFLYGPWCIMQCQMWSSGIRPAARIQGEAMPARPNTICQGWKVQHDSDGSPPLIGREAAKVRMRYCPSLTGQRGEGGLRTLPAQMRPGCVDHGGGHGPDSCSLQKRSGGAGLKKLRSGVWWRSACPATALFSSLLAAGAPMTHRAPRSPPARHAARRSLGSCRRGYSERPGAQMLAAGSDNGIGMCAGWVSVPMTNGLVLRSISGQLAPRTARQRPALP